MSSPVKSLETKWKERKYQMARIQAKLADKNARIYWMEDGVRKTKEELVETKQELEETKQELADAMKALPICTVVTCLNCRSKQVPNWCKTLLHEFKGVLATLSRQDEELAQTKAELALKPRHEGGVYKESPF